MKLLVRSLFGFLGLGSLSACAVELPADEAGQTGDAVAACTDTPPDTRYTCAQQASWGKCGEPWMAGKCDASWRDSR
jgi:hypothetical protein